MIGEHVNVLAVLHLACPDQEQMIERIQRRALLESRLDDANLEIIRQRFETYKQETQPVLDCFAADIVYAIDSTQSPVKVLSGVAEALGQLEFCNCRRFNDCFPHPIRIPSSPANNTSPAAPSVVDILAD